MLKIDTNSTQIRKFDTNSTQIRHKFDTKYDYTAEKEKKNGKNSSTSFGRCREWKEKIQNRNTILYLCIFSPPCVPRGRVEKKKPGDGNPREQSCIYMKMKDAGPVFERNRNINFAKHAPKIHPTL